jgi:uncharacterized protein (DUF885 family)
MTAGSLRNQKSLSAAGRARTGSEADAGEEAAAFHEAVPGHHPQLSRLKLITDVSVLTDG